ncbi:MAG: hypothetical protein HY332_08650 [Chloroflexi bacterium]|nr:hypothetical protein [Chloroflexota bacterium]
MPARRTRLSLAEAAAAAERNGIKMRLFELRYEPGPEAFGYRSSRRPPLTRHRGA